MKTTSVRQTLLAGVGLVTVAAAAFGGWWLQDVRLAASWEPDWPQSVRITGESVEKIAGGDKEVSEGDRARAAERARWKAYYYAQLRAAEQLGSLKIAAETSIRDLAGMDQELRASFAGALSAAAEIDSEIELLDDAVRARVTVEIPAAPMRDLKTVLAEALRAGRVSIERRPRQPAPPAGPRSAESAGIPPAASTPAPGPPAEDVAAPPPTVSGPRPPAEPAAEADFEDAPEPPATVVQARTPPPRPAPEFTGAAVHLGEKPYRLGVTSVLYELGGAEIGSVLDLPPERLTAGFFPIADPGDAGAVRRLAGPSPRELEATISGRDLFLSERLSAEEVRQMQQWLRAGKVVLVLG